MSELNDISTWKWVNSNGGPLICVCAKDSGQWRGNEGTTLADSASTDYERACKVVALVEVLPMPGGQVLVFGDESLQTTWLKIGGVSHFVRWVQAETKPGLGSDIIGALDNVAFTNSGLVLKVNETALYRLFDSAEPGDDILGDHYEMELDRGSYCVEMATLNLENDAVFDVIRLTRIAN